MPKISAGLFMYRVRDGRHEVLLVHPGGPFWAKKDQGSWSIPKGEAKDHEKEDLLKTAKREFEEETGIKPEGDFEYLTSVKSSSGKIVQVWMFEGDCDPKLIKSNTVFIEWPPKTGKKLEISEVDRADFFSLNEAKTKLVSYQVKLIQNFSEKHGILKQL